MMDRRRFLLTSVAGVLAAPLGAETLAQTRDGRPARVGILIVSRPASDDGCKAGLHGLGYVEGKTVVYELRSADNRLERLPDLAAELVGAHVDVIFAAGTATATAAARVSSTVPIVFAGVADPIASGLAESLARPGKNASGLTAINVELVGKRRWV
jgi:putative tryptophan/tyrosine transport system substrate-binding protein